MRQSPVSLRRPQEQNRPGGGQQRAGRAWRGNLKVGRLSTGLQQAVEKQRRDSDSPDDMTRVTQQGLGVRLKWEHDFTRPQHPRQ